MNKDTAPKVTMDEMNKILKGRSKKEIPSWAKDEDIAKNYGEIKYTWDDSLKTFVVSGYRGPLDS